MPGGRHESDQAGVWDEVQEELARLGAASPTMASASQCSRLPPRKYASRFSDARFRYQNLRPMTAAE